MNMDEIALDLSRNDYLTPPKRHDRIVSGRCVLMPRATSDAQLRANAKYDAANTKRFGVKFNLTHDEDVIMLLDAIDSKQGLIKQLLREYIRDRRLGVTDEIFAKYIQLNSPK